ncbi:RNA-binding protein [Dulcicalothrix desertica PCC 7102]|uniref:RNA-binding protein n=1 Tax=Dulcicalothrix desertica PCC 7102 TaxID=232991 RepID=A0A433VAE4_9CYAN|nr:RNA-binding protein [Dulcicalothrix desertica]RUT03071.1 RNA-binding protein [Dulcicalothrix desertica PCC 7102]TWH53448.1 RNA-binding proteins (RRM domain) [Dulcicalothrix desertica PCC 7102]
MSVRLYIGNLPKEEIDRQDLQAVFAAEGDAVTTKLIKDRKTGKCRGFGFLTVNNDDQADAIIEKYNGQMFKDSPIKLEKALPRTKGEEGDEQPQQAAPVKERKESSGSPAAPVSSGGGSNRESSSRKSSKKSRRGGGGQKETVSTSSGGDSDAIRPDPRWAAQLETLKQRLAAQTTN